MAAPKSPGRFVSSLTRRIYDVDVTRPTTPGGFSATAISATRIDLAWSASTDPAGGSNQAVTGVAGYRVYSNDALVASPTGLSYSLTGLSEYVSYAIAVASIDGATPPNESLRTAVINRRTLDATAPTAPVISAAATSSSAATITLTTAATDSMSGVVSTALERKLSSGSTWSVLTSNATFPYDDTSLSASTGYDWRARSTDAQGNVGAYSAVTSATTQAASSGSALTWEWNAPTLAQERATYDLIGFAREASDEQFDSRYNAAGAGGFSNIHDDQEGDDLWLWDQQQKRYSLSLTNNWRTSWLNWYKNSYLSILDSTDGDSAPSGFGYDHLTGQGIATVYRDTSDAGALSVLNSLRTRITSRSQYQTIVSGGSPALAYWEARGPARWLLVACYAAQATNDAQWITIRNNLIDGWLRSPDWVEGGNIVAGGMYHASREQAQYASGSGGIPAYDAGRRFNATWHFGILAEAFWRAYVQTGRSDVRDRLIKLAQYTRYYAHRSTWNWPNVGTRFGHEANGGYFHSNTADGTATTAGKDCSYDLSLINLMVFAYKLTGDTTYLLKARKFWDRGSRFDPGPDQNGIYQERAAAGQVFKFADVWSVSGGYPDYNAGWLQYGYGMFEDGGKPALLTTTPSWYPPMAVNAGRSFANSSWSANVGPAPGTSGQTTGRGPFTYSGGFIVNQGLYQGATWRPGPFLGVFGGGHGDYNGNEVLAYGPFTAESPGWITVCNANPAAAQASFNGNQMASHHSYGQNAVLQNTNRLLLPVVNSLYPDSGFRFESATFDFDVASPNSNLTTAWKKSPDVANCPGPSTEAYGACGCYDEVGRRYYYIDGWGATHISMYNEDANTWTRYPSSGTKFTQVSYGDRKTCAIDPVSKVMMMVSSGAVPVCIDMRTPPSSEFFTPSGSNRPQGTGGVIFDPVNRRWVYYAGGNTMLVCPAPSNPYSGGSAYNWTSVTITGDTLPNIPAAGNGMYNRFQYCPYPRGYVAVAGHDTNVVFIKAP